MNKEDKKLLLKDLYGRLPYGVNIQTTGVNGCTTSGILFDISNINENIIVTHSGIEFGYEMGRDEIKPYLRPMLSMTNKEKETYHKKNQSSRLGMLEVPIEHHLFRTQEAFDWLNAHHFDYRSLIERGLALEAPEGMYNMTMEE